MSNWSKEELKKVRKGLPDGAREAIAEKHGLTVEYVNNILRGHKENDSVVLDAIELAKKHKESQEEKINQAREAIAEL